jgi:hypothetical protein
MAQAYFEPTFSCINTLTILKPSYYSSYLLAYEDGTECSETSAYKIQTPGNYPEETIQHSQHGESLKSKLLVFKPSFQTFICNTALCCKQKQSKAQ